LGALSREVKFQQDEKNKVITLKDKKDIFLGRYKGGPLGSLSCEAKFQQDDFFEVFYSART
jgi:hypothetical protein